MLLGPLELHFNLDFNTKWFFKPLVYRDDHSGKEYSETDIARVRMKQKELDELHRRLTEMSIYVCGFHTRSDMLQAMIIGPPGTPYHNGLFFFDIKLPDQYPNQLPEVVYHSYRRVINPMIDKRGRFRSDQFLNDVKLGDPGDSVVIQVLQKIKEMVFNDKPYGEAEFNLRAFLSTCYTMLEVIKDPPPLFRGDVRSHFRESTTRETILLVFDAYVSGRLEVGEYIGSSSLDTIKPSAWMTFEWPKEFTKKRLIKLRKKLDKAFTELATDRKSSSNEGSMELSFITTECTCPPRPLRKGSGAFCGTLIVSEGPYVGTVQESWWPLAQQWPQPFS